ncbi:helix-turn-helix domain-containing protein [Kocuria marina]|uniref:helix-turn-helix domain-containing protein n=1 Tax=Kocuria marina TaxID=223184 RepID=UPI003805CBB1
MADFTVEMPKLMTCREVAEVLKVPVSTVQQWSLRGEGPPSFKIGKHRRFDAEMMARWLADRKDAAA